MGLNPIFVDFSRGPQPRSNAATVRANRAEHSVDHWSINARGSVCVDFHSDGPDDEVTLQVKALVSKLGRNQGYSPLDIVFNEETVVSGHRIPGGGDLPQEMSFAIEGGLLRNGTNTLELRTAADAKSMLWLYRVLLESVWDRGAAERALLDDAVIDLALVYRTYTRSPDTDDWRPGQQLHLRIDNGKAALPAKLSWRCQDGSQAAISLALELTSFLGHIQTKDGQWLLYRGDLIRRDSEVHGSARHFYTEVSWGELTTWYQAEEISIYLEAGSGQLQHIGWMDTRGNSASVGFACDGSSFSGYSQNANEGPIAFRGTTGSPNPAAPG